MLLLVSINKVLNKQTNSRNFIRYILFWCWSCHIKRFHIKVLLNPSVNKLDDLALSRHKKAGVLLQGHMISHIHVKSYQGPWLEKPCHCHKEDRASHDTRVQKH